MITAAAALLALATGCGAQPTYITAHGIGVIDEKGLVLQADVEKATDIMLSVLPVNSSFDGLTVEFTDHVLKQNGELYSGLAKVEEDKVRVFVEDTCLAKTAFIHELGHIAQYDTDAVKDGGHDALYWWSEEGAVETAIDMAIEVMCPTTKGE